LAIASSTSLRRVIAARAFWNGLYWDGACGRPASVAASASVRSRACLSKNVSDAASTPIAVRPPTVP
jgi:hypothetical protein